MSATSPVAADRKILIRAIELLDGGNQSAFGRRLGYDSRTVRRWLQYGFGPRQRPVRLLCRLIAEIPEAAAYLAFESRPSSSPEEPR